MHSNSKQPSPDESALKRAVRHPRRLEILGFLAGAASGTDEAELAEALGLKPPLVKYHLEVLRNAALVTHVVDPQPSGAERYVISA